MSPPLALADVPEGTRSLALIVEDPDAPLFLTWTHWVVFNVPPGAAILEAASPGVLGRNSWRSRQYRGPCPPWGTHRYVFRAFALDRKLDLAAGATRKALLRAMKGHVLAECHLTGMASRRGAG